MSDEQQAERNVPKWLLEQHAPRLVDLLGPSNKDWGRLAVKMDSRMAVAERGVAETGTWTAPTTLVDLAYRAEFDAQMGTHEGRAGLAFLRFIEAQAVELCTLVDRDLLPTVRREMRDLFINFNANESKYLDKVGELAASVYLLRSTRGRLAGIEVGLPQLPTKIDVVIDLPGSGQVPVEYLNIHVNDARLTSPEDLHAFLDGRVRRKIEAKLKRPHPEGTPPPFPLLLILWFQNVETLQRFAGCLMGRASNEGSELPICTLQQYGDGNGYVEWRFASVAQLVGEYGLLAGGGAA